MIISHKHRFIFMKTSKTAGTSIEIELSKFLGPQDVITPISEDDEALREDWGGHGPQNYEIRANTPFIKKMKAERCWQGGFYNHMSALEVKNLVDPDVWQNYFKFCVVRSPWERVVSNYYWRYKTETRPSMD